MSNRLDLEGIKNVIQNGEGSFPRPLAIKLIAEVERLRMEEISKKETIVKDTKAIWGKGGYKEQIGSLESQLAAVGKKRDQIHKSLVIRTQTTQKQDVEIEKLEAELAKARPGWCPICHERIYNKVKAENAELKDRLFQAGEHSAIKEKEIAKLKERVEELESKLAAVCYDHHKDTTGEDQ